MEKILKSIEVREQEMIGFLEQIVNIDSGEDNPEGNSQVAEIIGNALNKMGFAVEYLHFPDICTHVKAYKKGTGAKHVMIIGHLDTLFPKGTASKRSFTIKDDKAYGPGVLDMKGGITIALFALQALYDNDWNDKDITVFFCGDEEIAHPKTNAPELFELEARGKDAVFNMETASAGDAVLIGRKGNLCVEMMVTGISVHAGADMEKGANAILELAYKAIEVGKLTDFNRGLTFNVGTISGGIISNAVPDKATIKIDIRYLTEFDRVKAIESLNEIAASVYIPGTKTEIVNIEERFTPMEVTEDNKKLFEIVREQGEKIGLNIEAKVGGGSSDAGWTVRAGAPSLCAMGAMGEFNHTSREYIFVDSLVKRAKLLALSIDAV